MGKDFTSRCVPLSASIPRRTVLDYAGLKRRLNGISSIRRKLSLGNLQKISKALAITLSELF